MSDDDALRAAAQAGIELDQTEAAFAAVRTALVDRLFSTGVLDSLAREKLYLAVQQLDAVRKALLNTVQSGDMIVHARQLADELAA